MAIGPWLLFRGIVYIGILCGVCISQDDPCTDPIDLSDPRRSVDYTDDNGNSICDADRIVEGNWYTLNSYTGGKMPESCPDLHSCGTQAPIWFDGIHPTDDTIQDAKVCVRIGDCCQESYTIKVKKCADETFVYQLANPTACDLAYCAGSGLPCADGTVWVDGTKQCENGYPVMSGPPVLSGPVPPNDPFFGTFHFSCDIQYDGNDDTAMFEVRWYFDGIEDGTVEVSRTTSHSVLLDELKLKGHMGKKVSCSAKSYWPDKYDLADNPVDSVNSYWVGIQGPALTVMSEDEEGDTEIVFTSTVPITCGCCLGDVEEGFPFKDKASCKFQFRFNAFGIAEDQAQSCSVTFVPGEQASSLNAAAERLGNIRNQLSQINFFQYSNILQQPIWNDYNIPPALVQIKNEVRTGHCRSITDPHITTFDGRYYTVYEPGNFLLVRSSSSRLFEIHSHLRTCLRNPSVSCNCGVAVREGNIIIGVDNCEGHFRSFKKRLLGTSQNHGTLTTNAAGTEFTIVMPSGARVVASNDIWWHLNVYVYLPSEDYKKTEGLCGTWDGNKMNDITHTHKLAPGRSFFDGDAECEILLDQDKPNHCKCESDTNIKCKPFPEDMIDNVFDDTCISERRKRSMADFDSIFGDLAEEEEYTELGNITWPTASGITEDEAKEKCQQVLEESLVNDLCQNVTTVNKTELQASCVLDIQIADNLTFGDSMRNVFESECKEESQLNVIIGNETDEAAQELAQAIDSNVCINQCSGHGTCVNSLCQCEADYLGADCSVDIGTPPEITALLNDGLCDTQSNTCQGIKVTANVVINNTVCRYREVAVLTDGVIDLNVVVQTGSRILSNTKAFCDLPNDIGKVFATYQLAISFDGETFSEGTMVYIYNSECVECTPGAACMIMADTCDIAGQCYSGRTCTACEDAIDIGDPKRSGVYELQAHDVYLCDAYRIVSGYWYKFDQYTGNKMPEQCIDTWHCGTQATIWLDGTHPTAGVPVTSGLACANYNDTSCCDWSAPVSIKYCTDDDDEVFYAYQLTPPPGCEMAYCSGNVMPCLDGEEWDEDSEACVDIDECASDPCVHGDCSNNANHFVCDCEEGYTGVTCNEEINKCDEEPCVHGSCEASFNSYTCLCDAGFTGTDCELDIDECDSSPCENNGECNNGENQYTCNCLIGYSGKQCTTGVWLSWEEWSGCSTTCGPGYRQRERSCMVEEDLCDGDKVDVDVCSLDECDTSEPAGSGTVIEVSADSMYKVIINADGFKLSIATSINLYCGDHQEECCRSMDLPFSRGNILNFVTSSSVTVTLLGRNEDTQNIRYAIVVKIETTIAFGFCGARKKSRAMDPLFVTLDGETVANAIHAYSDTIEIDTGIVITDPGVKTDTATEVTHNPITESTYLTLIIVLAVVGVVVIAFIIVIVVFAKMMKDQQMGLHRIAKVKVASAGTPQEIKLHPNEEHIFAASQYVNPAPPVYHSYDQKKPSSGCTGHMAQSLPLNDST